MQIVQQHGHEGSQMGCDWESQREGGLGQGSDSDDGAGSWLS